MKNKDGLPNLETQKPEIRISLSKKQFEDLYRNENGEAILAGVNLSGKTISEGDEVILLDEYDKETPAVFVELVQEEKRGKGGQKVKVRLLK